LHFGERVAEAAVDAEPERNMLARPRPAVSRFGPAIASSSRLPEMYQITILSPFLTLLPPISRRRARRAAYG
jgi:hypothetical protein